MYLAKSTDLKNWEQVVMLDAHASQGKIHVMDNGNFLLAYEVADPKNNDNWIRLRYYHTLKDLMTGNYER